MDLNSLNPHNSPMKKLECVTIRLVSKGAKFGAQVIWTQSLCC